MPINLINLYSTRNIGDAAILAALASMSPDRQAYARIPDLAPLPVPGLVAADRCDPQAPLISVGGDIFNNNRPWFFTRRFLDNLRELTADSDRTAVFGQSVPRSCRGLAFSSLARVMRRLPSITVRDEESWRRLRTAGVKANLSHDAAFALEPTADAEVRGASILAAKGLAPAKTALFSLRGFDRMYPHDQELFNRAIGQTMTKLVAQGHQCVILIQADAEGSDSDVAIARKLQMTGLPVKTLDLVHDHTGNPVAEMIAVLASANIVFAVRYHTAILRLVAGRMPVVISYSNKTRDLIDRLSLPGMNIEDMDADALIALGLQSAGKMFSPEGLRSSVRQSFAAMMKELGR